MIMGIAYLAFRTNAVPSTKVSVVSEIARTMFGAGFMFWLVQVSTFAILILAANTSFQGFPASRRCWPATGSSLGSSRTWATGSCTRTG